MISTKEQLLKLQNGSDVRGVAVEGAQPVNLTRDAAARIAGGFVSWLADRLDVPPQKLRIGVGHDSRISAPWIKEQVLEAVAALGATPYDCGLASTPSMYMALLFKETAFDGSIMITASHLPANRNGMKFFYSDGGLEKADVTAVLERASTLTLELAPVQAEQVKLLDLYAASMREQIQKQAAAPDYEHPLAGLHIVVDAGNGAGGFFADRVLAPLGADVSGSQFLEPDGTFPNHIPNPEDAAAMASICAAVRAHGADLGIIFDTDVDRMSAVLSDGSEVNRDAIIAMMAAILQPTHPHGTIVTDSVTSDKLTAFLEGVLGLRHHRYKRGYKNVINECRRLNGQGIDSPLAIETSGHGALRENYYLDDGAYLAVKLLAAASVAKRDGRRVDSLIEKLERQFEAHEFRMRIEGEDFAAYGSQVLDTFEQRAIAAGITVAPDSHEGVRLTFEGDTQGWALLRVSLHDPLMPLNIEGNRAGDCARILRLLERLLEGFERLDRSVLGML